MMSTMPPTMIMTTLILVLEEKAEAAAEVVQEPKTATRSEEDRGVVCTRQNTQGYVRRGRRRKSLVVGMVRDEQRWENIHEVGQCGTTWQCDTVRGVLTIRTRDLSRHGLKVQAYSMKVQRKLVTEPSLEVKDIISGCGKTF
eukprot:65381_1